MAFKNINIFLKNDNKDTKKYIYPHIRIEIVSTFLKTNWPLQAKMLQ